MNLLELDTEYGVWSMEDLFWNMDNKRCQAGAAVGRRVRIKGDRNETKRGRVEEREGVD